MKLEVSRRTDLALRLLRLVASSPGPVSGRRVAPLLGTSATFLAQVAAPLLARGWLESRPGPGGGYSAGDTAVGVSVLDVVEAVEGPIDDATCVLAGGPCGTEPCAMHAAWLDARVALRSALAGRMAIDRADIAG